MVDDSNYEKTSKKAVSRSLDKIDGEFALKSYKDNNSIIYTIYTYLSLYNVTCFKHRVAIIRKF